MKRILFIVGSTREKSFNRQLSTVAAQMLHGKAEVAWLDYSDVPFLNQDKEFPAPHAVEALRKTVAEADGLWIVTPEYNSSYPGYLKNMLDWLSRPFRPNDYAGGTAARGKKVTISGVSGKSAAAGSRGKLLELLNFIGMNVCGAEGEGFSLEKEEWVTDVLTLSEEDQARLQAQADRFLAFLG
jgi:NAD(P)H-dependent FMN reductase